MAGTVKEQLAEGELREMIRRSLLRMDMRANNVLMVGLVLLGHPVRRLAELSIDEEGKLPAEVRAYWEESPRDD